MLFTVLRAAGFAQNLPKIEMVRIEGGTFQTGGNNSEYYEDDEKPVYQVTVSSFYIGRYEVTQKEYYEVMGMNPSYHKGDNLPERVSWYDVIVDNLPVERVSWYDAIAFCNKLSISEGLTPAYGIAGKTNPAEWGTVPENRDDTWDAVTIADGATGYRLPTEAQWEYAAKGGNGSPGNYIYSGSDNADDVAWYADNSGAKTHKAGWKAPNGLGLYDMSGNVREWCWDRYGAYTGEARTDPNGASSGVYRVLRGGSWYDSADDVRSASRSDYNPSYRWFHNGFRLARPAKE